MEANSREERLKKLQEAKERLTNRDSLPTIRKEDLELSTINSKMNSLQENTKKEVINNRINEVRKSLSTLKEAKSLLKEIGSNQTEVVFIIDKSGSVGGTESQVSKGILNIINKEKSKGRKDIITTVLFDNYMTTIHDRLPIEYVNSFSYTADGGTALYDTLVKQINTTKLKQSSDILKPKNTIFAISTDGEDLHSEKFTSRDVRRLVKEQTDAGWQFIFLGTNFNVIEVAKKLGIKASNAAEYSTLRLSDNFKAIEKALDDVHETGEVTEEWSKPITGQKTLSAPDKKTYTKKLLGDKE